MHPLRRHCWGGETRAAQWEHSGARAEHSPNPTQAAQGFYFSTSNVCHLEDFFTLPEYHHTSSNIFRIGHKGKRLSSPPLPPSIQFSFIINMICHYLKRLWPKMFISSQRTAVRSLKNTNFHFYYITSPSNSHRDGEHPGLALPCLFASLWEEKACTKARCLLGSRTRRPWLGATPTPTQAAPATSPAAREALPKEWMSPG